MRRQIRSYSYFLRRSLAASLAIVAVAAGPTRAHAEPAREFIMSCSYGVLAGTLVGAATLAFTDKPGENINKVARGASLGLYAGMILGAYVAYGIPSDVPEDDPAALGVGLGQPLPPSQTIVRRTLELPPVLLSPVISERGLEGATLTYSFYKF